MATEAHLRGNSKYLAKLDEIRIRVPKGKKQEYKTQAEKRGMSLNAYIVNLLEQDKTVL